MVNNMVDDFRIYFADLTHTGQGSNADTLPLGAGLIAAYVKQCYKNIEVKLYKLPGEFNKDINNAPPRVVCFSNYAWNERLSLEYAKYIKRQNESTVVVFGGPNFPLEREKSREYLLKYSQIDFFIKWDGEFATVSLIEKLLEYNFAVNKLKNDRPINDNLCYIDNKGNYIEGLDGRVSNINDMPSPYIYGLFDELLRAGFIPLFETTRGCPYGCTFCNDGHSHRSKLSRRSIDNIRKDIEYAAKNGTSRTMFLSDLNFGMYKEDIETSKLLADIIKKYDWPDRFETSTGKAHPLRLIESNEIINSVKPGVFKLGYSFQSTNQDVLKHIKRRNLSLDNLQDMTTYFQGNESKDLEFFTELILALPGDTPDRFMQSLRDVTDVLLTNNIDVHQLTLLKGSAMDTDQQRKLYSLKSKFRVFVGCLGKYKFGSDTKGVFEIEEVVLSNETFPYKDYVEARILHLLIKIYVDHNPFIEVMTFIRMKNISIIDVLVELRDSFIPYDKNFIQLIESFKRGMSENIFDTKIDLISFLELDGNKIDKYIAGEYGLNELLIHRSDAFITYSESVHNLLYKSIISILKKNALYSKLYDQYVFECIEFSKLKKIDINNIFKVKKGTFSFDFTISEKKNYKVEPHSIVMSKKRTYSFTHTDSDKKKIATIVGGDGNTRAKNIGKLYQRYNLIKLNRKVESIN